MVDSDAYRTLSAKTQLVLIDMIRQYDQGSGFDTAEITHIGFGYSWNQCRVPVSKRFFYQAAIPLILEHGFFKRRELRVDEMKSNPAHSYIPLRDWRWHEPSQGERAAEDKRKAGKQREHERDRLRQERYRAQGWQRSKKVDV